MLLPARESGTSDGQCIRKQISRSTNRFQFYCNDHNLWLPGEATTSLEYSKWRIGGGYKYSNKVPRLRTLCNRLQLGMRTISSWYSRAGLSITSAKIAIVPSTWKGKLDYLRQDNKIKRYSGRLTL